MAGEIKDPDRVYVETKIMNEVINAGLGEEGYLLLGKSTCQRADLFLFAMALGWAKKLKPKLEKPIGLARRESFSGKVSTAIDAVHFAEIGYDSPDGLRNRSEAFDLAERYANGGFHLIAGEIQANKTSEEAAYELIEEMDEMHEEWFGAL